MAKAIKLAELRPFLASVLLEAENNITSSKLLKSVIGVITEEVERSSPARRRHVIETTQIEREKALIFQAVIYCEKRSPPWLTTSAFEDVCHHLVVVAVRDKSVALCASDASMRERIVKNLKVARRIPRDRIAAFVGSEAKALWLNGVHTPTATKADTKVLTGGTLEYAIDPIGDQTYFYSAARTKPRVPGLEDKDKRPMVVGAAPAGARIWIRRADDWATFKKLLGAILDHAASSVRGSDPFASLSQAVDTVEGIEKAYAISVVPEELLSEDEVSDTDLEIARRWAFDAAYEVKATDALSLDVIPTLFGKRLGTLALSVSLSDRAVQIDGDWKNKDGADDKIRDECVRCLTDPGKIKIYYESGHCITHGHCYVGGFSDQPFDWNYYSFKGYSLKDEKPKVPQGSTLADCIAVNGDNSLFAYVCEKMFLDTKGKPAGWLASDDGSMELADFIHIDPDKKVISLIHVKASKSKSAERKAAPADFEVVVSQAVKNLRHLDRRKLVDELTKGKAKKIGAAVWRNGVKQKNRDDFLKAAEKLPASASKVLIVLQPRLTMKEVTRCRAPRASAVSVMRMKQIDTLMLAARGSALACGSSFVGIADSGT